MQDVVGLSHEVEEPNSVRLHVEDVVPILRLRGGVRQVGLRDHVLERWRQCAIQCDEVVHHAGFVQLQGEHSTVLQYACDVVGDPLRRQRIRSTYVEPHLSLRELVDTSIDTTQRD